MSKMTKQERREIRIAEAIARKSAQTEDVMALLRKSADALIELDSEQDYDVTSAMELHAELASRTLQSQFNNMLEIRDNRDNAFGVTQDNSMIQALTHDVGAQLRQLGVTQKERVVSGLLDMVIGTIHYRQMTA